MMRRLEEGQRIALLTGGYGVVAASEIGYIYMMRRSHTLCHETIVRRYGRQVELSIRMASVMRFVSRCFVTVEHSTTSASAWKKSLVLATLTVAAVGCGQKTPDYPSARLEGTVKIDGKPLAEGLIMLLPVDTGCGSGVKATIKDGQYAIAKAPRGNVLVTFGAMRATGRMVTSPLSSKPLPEQINLIPAQYRSGIAIQVQGDKNDQDFDLK